MMPPPPVPHAGVVLPTIAAEHGAGHAGVAFPAAPPPEADLGHDEDDWEDEDGFQEGWMRHLNKFPN